jgi:hypothetical protein
MSKGNQPRIERERVGVGTLELVPEVSRLEVEALKERIEAIERWMDAKLGTHLAKVS